MAKDEQQGASEPFTIGKALDIQRRHLAEWERVLKPEVWSVIKGKVYKETIALLSGKVAPNPYDVPRGDTISYLVHRMRMEEPEDPNQMLEAFKTQAADWAIEKAILESKLREAREMVEHLNGLRLASQKLTP